MYIFVTRVYCVKLRFGLPHQNSEHSIQYVVFQSIPPSPAIFPHFPVDHSVYFSLLYVHGYAVLSSYLKVETHTIWSSIPLLIHS